MQEEKLAIELLKWIVSNALLQIKRFYSANRLEVKFQNNTTPLS